MDGPIRDAIVDSPGLDTRLDWVEPVVKSMMFGETAHFFGPGPDGGGVDCTAS